MENNLNSLNKLKSDMQSIEVLGLLLPRAQRKQLKEMKQQLVHMEQQISLFNARFSDNGWCAYDSMNFALIEKANMAFESVGIEAAETVLVAYYKADVKDIVHWLKASADELMNRCDLIQKAFEYHFTEGYHASILLLLIIIDGAVNDFTQSKGFFAEGTDVTAWDCLVGCTDGLTKLKSIFNKGRGKTNKDPIYLPYRNGILHGRDLNFANEYVSCKCVALLFAVADWMKMKSSENDRKEKFRQESYVSPMKELAAKIQKNNEDKEEIARWTPHMLRVGFEIPPNGTRESYDGYPYLLPIYDTFDCWKKKNYGELSILLKNMLGYKNSDKKRAGECRVLFGDKQFSSFKFLEVQERACSLTRILVQVEWMHYNKAFHEQLEFGCVYQDENNRSAFPWRDNGTWVIIPWNVQALYKS